ncbi:helix-turn-helix domain-containing protein [Pedobacter fastidiosus]|uniref:Helix-turn-helix transcriptional regulator n=1 Tax=Pedobacter fastidiosus TaxID=2765361 RepID=A0ABR7KYZ0_9SPHI|nr:helix-turn-helix transcriptional regulator [Pedobacter fastidiosus]
MNEKKDLLLKLGSRVRDIRLSKGLTQTELAHSLGKDQQSIQRLETGNVNPSYIYLLQIAKGLNVELNELLNF